MHVRQTVDVYWLDVDLLQFADEVRRRGRTSDDRVHRSVEPPYLRGVDQSDLRATMFQHWLLSRKPQGTI